MSYNKSNLEEIVELENEISGGDNGNFVEVTVGEGTHKIAGGFYVFTFLPILIGVTWASVSLFKWMINLLVDPAGLAGSIVSVWGIEGALLIMAGIMLVIYVSLRFGGFIANRVVYWLAQKYNKIG